ncbi:hypothetical protein F7232_02455 [Corynebacterium sp. 319]|uniref:hypothetical protein n=1 Tax=unclassified Corynebacterium TaxID=2624378 RepID=UPI0013016255|nr:MULTISPECIES: hypothetical protein [unclassified Corynebacterium]KAB1553868.1 hypothetical protein F7232_02455 [Corynebacterium sp. 319]
MSEGSDQVINLNPEWGVEWGIWGGQTEEELRNSSGFASPQSLGLSPGLTKRLRDWNKAWLDNYEGPWLEISQEAFCNTSRGFLADINLNEWIREGFIISHQLEQESGYVVEVGFARSLCANYSKQKGARD